MACSSFTIPDDNMPLQTVSYIGGFLGIDAFRDVIPRLILNPGGGCTPTFDDIVSSIFDTLFTAISLFFLLNLIFPGTMAFFSNNLSYRGMIGVLNGYISLGQLIYIWFPVVALLVVFSMRKADPDGKDDEKSVSWLMMILLLSLFGGLLLLVFGAGATGAMMRGGNMTFTDILLFIIGVCFLASTAKYILPAVVLLLGPGSIPAMLGKSFLSFCA